MKLPNYSILSVMSLVTVCPACISSARAQQGKPVQPAENISYLDNGVIRLGVDLNLGGSITYLAASSDRVNMINSHDWGRQIQMSFYSGPQPFTPNGKQPSKTWAYLGWNSIQSGDYIKIESISWKKPGR